jgi:hypothetical protein
MRSGSLMNTDRFVDASHGNGVDLNTVDGSWYWVQFNGGVAEPAWVPAQRRGKVWISVEFSGVPLDAVKLGSCLSFSESPVSDIKSMVDISAGAREVLNERLRQINVEGWSPSHDDSYQENELVRAAVCYAVDDISWNGKVQWPFNPLWWKNRNKRNNLIKATAMLMAAIDAIDRKRSISPPQ